LQSSCIFSRSRIYVSCIRVCRDEHVHVRIAYAPYYDCSVRTNVQELFSIRKHRSVYPPLLIILVVTFSWTWTIELPQAYPSLSFCLSHPSSTYVSSLCHTRTQDPCCRTERLCSSHHVKTYARSNKETPYLGHLHEPLLHQLQRTEDAQRLYLVFPAPVI
jgi:hypothetical protein